MKNIIKLKTVTYLTKTKINGKKITRAINA